MKGNANLAQVRKMLVEAEYTVIFTGAGISRESGVPTFRGEDGLWTRYDPQEVASLAGFKREPEAFWEFAEELLLKSEAEPNPGHLALAELERKGVVDTVITQNIDMLHQRAGSRTVFELHGSLKNVDCLRCGEEYTWEEIAAELPSPSCRNCGSRHLKPGIIFFGENLDEEIFNKARAACTRCDLLIVVGSSLQVYPAADLPKIARKGEANLALINRDPTQKDHLFDIVLRGKAGEILPLLT